MSKRTSNGRHRSSKPRPCYLIPGAVIPKKSESNGKMEFEINTPTELKHLNQINRLKEQLERYSSRLNSLLKVLLIDNENERVLQYRLLGFTVSDTDEYGNETSYFDPSVIKDTLEQKIADVQKDINSHMYYLRPKK